MLTTMEKGNLAEKPKYLTSVMAVRGIAALAVCLFHFTKGFIAEIKGVAMFIPYSWIGVEVFFVISGFVIPYSLLKTRFRLSSYKNYMVKRILRIEPAYLISIVMIIFLNYLSTLVPIYQGAPFQISLSNLALHLGYLVDFFDEEWLNPVYWTLAIEFQFYIVIGFLILLWNNSTKWIHIISIVLFLAISFIPQDAIKFFSHTDVFTIGIVCAFYKRNLMSLKWYLPITLIIAYIILLNHGATITVLSLIVVLAIAFVNTIKQGGFIVFFGNISYSLYLLHVPIGGRILNLSKRLELNEFWKFMVVLVAVAVSILSAYIFYLVVEKPSHRLSRRYKLN